MTEVWKSNEAEPGVQKLPSPKNMGDTRVWGEKRGGARGPSREGERREDSLPPKQASFSKLAKQVQAREEVAAAAKAVPGCGTPRAGSSGPRHSPRRVKSGRARLLPPQARTDSRSHLPPPHASLLPTRPPGIRLLSRARLPSPRPHRLTAQAAPRLVTRVP